MIGIRWHRRIYQLWGTRLRRRRAQPLVAASVNRANVRLHRRAARALHRRIAALLLRTSSDHALHAFAVASATCRLPVLCMLPIARPALHALGIHPSLIVQLRFLWSLSYQIEMHVLLATQDEGLRKEWIRGYITPQGAPPSGGAILLTIHQVNATPIAARLAMLLQPLGIIAYTMHPRPTLFREAFGQNCFSSSQSVQTLRRSLQFLRQEGYLVVAGDIPNPTWPASPVLGKRMAIPPGITWLAQKSGKPIIPFALVPDGTRWRLWFGDPIEPTKAAVAAAVEDLIRRAPTTLGTYGWLAWNAAPPIQESATVTQSVQQPEPVRYGKPEIGLPRQRALYASISRVLDGDEDAIVG